MPDVLVGTVINRRYRLEQVLGSSVVDAVYRAVEVDLQTGLDRGPCIVRVLSPQHDLTQPPYLPDLSLVQDPGAIPLLRTREIGELRFGAAAGSVFLVYDVAEAGGPWSRSDAQAVVDGLLALHAAGGIHGHLKPANVVRVDGQWKLADQGLVPPYPQALIAYALAKNALGSLDPAVVRGQVNAGTDVWGLGVCLLHRIATGQPFVDAPPAQFLETLAYQSPHLPDDLPVPFDIVVPACLQRDPARRWTLDRVAAVLAGRLHVPDIVSSPHRSREGPARGQKRWRVTLSERPHCLALSPEGERLVVGFRSGEIRMWGPETMQWRLALPAAAVRILWTAENEVLVGDANGVLRWLSTDTGEVARMSDPGWGSVLDLVLLADHRVAAALGPRGVGVANGSGSMVVVPYPPCHMGRVAAAPDGGFYSAGLDGSLSRWRWDGGAQVVRCVAFHGSPISGLVAGCSAALDGTVVTWNDDLSESALCTELVRAGVAAGGVDAAGEWTVIGFEDGTAGLLKKRSDGTCATGRVEVAGVPVIGVSIASQTGVVAIASRRGTIDVWDFNSGTI